MPFTKNAMLILLLALIALGTHSVHAQALSPVSGVLEYYYLTGTGDKTTAKPTARYLHIAGQATSKFSYVIGQISKGGNEMLDENYLAFGDQSRLRVGRFRSAFGHSDWSECYYTGFARAPLVRAVALDGTLSLNRLDTGVDWQGDTGPMQIQVGLIDVGAKPTEVAASHPDHVIARVQTYVPNLIVGLNALTPVSGSGDRLNLFDLDWHWSKPHVQSSGEYLVGQGDGQHPHGYYADFFLHPQGLLRTTFLARAEALTARSSDSSSEYGGTPDPGNPSGYSGATVRDDASEYAAPRAEYNQLYTLGVKQILSRTFTLEVNRSWGRGDATQGRQGLSFQLITFVRF